MTHATELLQNARREAASRLETARAKHKKILDEARNVEGQITHIEGQVASFDDAIARLTYRSDS